ncbi:MAG: (d)CMP kinase [Synergistetes bacterium]|nr:(d)CMP kinase [Synergistota bacterium]MCX8127508.1 (d)CMP kinase [Synergistota bacterium]MDW8191576.1 (d)CMP kinase [Synergistota bacterium]
MIVAIDGPAGSGKTTVAKLVARRLGFFYLDTGAIYRALTLKLLRSNLPLDDIEGVCQVLNTMDINIEDDKLFLDGEDVSEAVRDPEVDRKVSLVARIPEVRERLLPLQRDLVKGRDAVVEGRDMGTIVFPEAEVKVFLTASIEERAYRRWKELVQKGKDISFEAVLQDLKRRDDIDSKREIAPLKVAPDAIVIDTTSKSIEDVVEEVVNLVLQYYKSAGILYT